MTALKMYKIPPLIPLLRSGKRIFYNDKNEKDSLALELKKEDNVRKQFAKTKVGKLQKKHPSWSIDDCENVLAKRIWIGMEYDMLVSERGRPNHINRSNYGNGEQYQFCWDDYSIGCFYSGEDYIITAYN